MSKGKSVIEGCEVVGGSEGIKVDVQSTPWFDRYIDEIVVAEYRRVEGRIKTLIEAIVPDAYSAQCKAQKDVVRELLWKGKDDLISMIIGAHNDEKE